MHLDQINPSQVDNLRPWVEAETGMNFSGSRITRFHDAVARVLSRQKIDNLDRLLAIRKERGIFLEQLACELTVGESFFFRNEHHFRALREHVLPAVVADNADKREVRAWSAGCATGEEPYSLAIVMEQVLGDDPNWQVSILGSDLNREFLARARKAQYRLWSFRHTTVQENQAYFLREGESFLLAPRFRDQVRFSYLNLVKDVYPSPLTGTLGLDLIVFRNVAIYLKPDLTEKIIERFRHALRPGGWLLLGEAEVSLASTNGFELRRIGHATFHQKPYSGDPSAIHSPTSMPVLADRPLDPWRRQTSETTAAAPTTPLQAVPTFPDWLPLPKRAAVSTVAESAVHQIDRLLAEGRFDDAECAIETIRDKKQRVKARLRLTQRLLTCASIARARQVLERCLADEPLMIEAQLLQASFAEESGDVEKAERAYRRALYIDRNCPMAHFHFALVLQQKGDMTGARRSVKTTLKLIENEDPHEPVPYGEGMCFGRLKEMALTILDFLSCG